MAHGLTFHHFAQPRQLIVNSSCRIIDMQQAINPRAKSIQISYMAHAPTIHNGSQHVRQPRSYRTNGINGMRTPRQAYEHISKPVKSQADEAAASSPRIQRPELTLHIGRSTRGTLTTRVEPTTGNVQGDSETQKPHLSVRYRAKEPISNTHCRVYTSHEPQNRGLQPTCNSEEGGGFQCGAVEPLESSSLNTDL